MSSQNSPLSSSASSGAPLPGASPIGAKADPYWDSSSPTPHYSSFHGDLEVDVAIVGSGITGLTAAYHLGQAGQSVVILEQFRLAGGESGHTSAHLTAVLDSRFSELESKIGLETAQALYHSNQDAINHIEELSRKLGIECEFQRVNAYLYAEKPEQASMIDTELAACKRLGIPAVRAEAPIGFPTHAALKLPNQAQFHPELYLQGVARSVTAQGAKIFEETQVTQIEETDSESILTTVAAQGGGKVRAKKVIMATNSPTATGLSMHTRIYAYRSYVVAAPLARPPTEQALFYDLDDPYHYTRQQKDVWVVGGEDHKTGMKRDTEQSFRALEEYVQSHFGPSPIKFRWSGQILISVDGIPFIGLAPFLKHRYIATGFAGNGLTFGTVAGLLLADLIVNKPNAYSAVYDPKRVNLKASLGTFISENADVPLQMIKDRLGSADVKDLSEIKAGMGATIHIRGEKLAVYHDPDHGYRAYSCVCTHMGCHVNWNSAEKSWDCPCHGSRFNVEGKVMNGPASTPLAGRSLQESV